MNLSKLLVFAKYFEKLAMSPNQAFSILGISSNAVPTEVKKKYRQLSMQYHPDKASNQKEKELFHHKFVEINSAYQVALEYSKDQYVSEKDEKSQIDKMVNEMGPLVSDEETSGYVDWMEENPGEYDRRREEARQWATEKVKRPRYIKLKALAAENAWREINWAYFFSEVRKIELEAENIKNSIEHGELFASMIYVSFISLYKIRDYAKDFIDNLDKISLEKLWADNPLSNPDNWFSHRIVNFYYDLKENIIPDFHKSIKDIEQVGIALNIDISGLLSMLNSFQFVLDNFEKQYSYFYELYSDIKNTGFLARLN